ncbi:M949_RS01915 family surface polysaccharide biosynthesis protein [Aquimarina algiphila]|uniref:M949_RS01915 family surface polysaccharide biosynthesis protein n=1 Tax=Aquimarina algiphila TaxID=2047982 RepID=UPI00249363E2|nr:hypothetical protein [Aquimarina algiphila]
MKSILIIICITTSVFCFGQTFEITSKQLSKNEVDSIFTNTLKDKLNIDYGIFRVYEYQDKSGIYMIVMTEKEYKIEGEKKYFDAIKAFNFKVENGNYTQQWMIRDFFLEDNYSEEYYISFWTKYFEIKDYDGDGLVDPILTYGTLAMNEYDDGRIKILIFYKGKKRAIRHKNGVHDDERNTQVDKEFYALPIPIQNRATNIMELITKNNHGIFPYGWETAMKNKELWFDEN